MSSIVHMCIIMYCWHSAVFSSQETYTHIQDVGMVQNAQDKLDTEKDKHLGHSKVGVEEDLEEQDLTRLPSKAKGQRPRWQVDKEAFGLSVYRRSAMFH